MELECGEFPAFHSVKAETSDNSFASCAKRARLSGFLDATFRLSRPAMRILFVTSNRVGDAVLSTGSGFGGFQSAMIFARPKELQS